MTKRYDGLDYLRAFSAIGILLMHILANGNYSVSGVLFEMFIPSLTDLVFLFMVISGFSMCCGYYYKVKNNELSVESFYRKRYIRILPFFALLCLIDFALSPNAKSFSEVFANLTLCFGFLPVPNMSVIGVGWFLGLVFAFYISFPFFCYLIQDKKHAWFSFVIALFLNLICAYNFNVDRSNIVYSYIFFVIGGLIYLYKNEINAFFKGGKRFWLFSLLMIGLVTYYLLSTKIFGIIIISTSLVILAILSKNRVPNCVKCISDLSMEIYLSHMVIYRFLEKLQLIHIFSNEVISYVFVSLTTFIGTFIFATILKKIIERIRFI